MNDAFRRGAGAQPRPYDLGRDHVVMRSIFRALVPESQRQSVVVLHDALDLGRGDVVGKRSGFLILLVLSAVIAVAGVMADSMATVIGAMIIAPLATPIMGIALGIVTSRPWLVLRSFLWVLGGLAIVVTIGWVLSSFIADPTAIQTNSQITGRTSPGLLDLLAALATGTAGAFAQSRKDLSAVLPGVAISISLVPPLGVVGVCAGQGDWGAALGALLLFLSNVVSLVIAGSIVFTVAGYARHRSTATTARRRRAYVLVTVLALVITVPLALNSAITVLETRWTADVDRAASQWLALDPTGEVRDVRWSGLTVIVDVTTDDGTVPDTASLASRLDTLPSFVTIVVDAGVARRYVVQTP